MTDLRNKLLDFFLSLVVCMYGELLHVFGGGKVIGQPRGTFLLSLSGPIRPASPI